MLSQQLREIVTGMTSTSMDLSSDPHIISQPIQWQPPSTSLTMVELFGIGTGLAIILDTGLIVHRYIHANNAFVPRKAAKHHIHQLMV